MLYLTGTVLVDKSMTSFEQEIGQLCNGKDLNEFQPCYNIDTDPFKLVPANLPTS